MRCHYISDLHLESQDFQWKLPKGDVLIIAGDLCHARCLDPARGDKYSIDQRDRVMRFAESAVANFDHVLLVEHAFGAELVLEPEEALVKRAEARAAHRVDGELEATARLVKRGERAHLHLHAIARLPVEESRPAAEHHALDLRRAVL